MLNSIKKKHQQILRTISDIVWIKEIKQDNKLFKDKLARLQLLYGLLIIFACLFSFVNLFVPLGQDTSTYAKVFITIAQVPVFFIFVFDFVIHLITYHYQNNEKNLLKLYFKFLTSYYSFVAIFCILASINLIGVFTGPNTFNSKIFDFFNALGIVRVLRLLIVLKIFSPFNTIFKAITQQSKLLINIFILVIVLILLFALVIWNAETSYYNAQVSQFIQKYANDHNLTKDQAEIQVLKDSNYPSVGSNIVSNFWDAIYFTTITLTTIGYGDFSPQSPTAKAIVVIISLIGVAVIAIPSGVIAASFLQQVQNKINKNNKREENND
ncbi:potassium channel family protein [Mycoplasma sp. 3686d]|uniref:potassium channel family protein n=1 Tax=Mycoplasma sp. 3686d TaxID=2967300 RepID=UPI00211BD11E|nr:potassium channel family protein [Mycoplasma sp. 3686d]UUM24707.1 potassium channel family protein [Mycoplasma sp. 3686d]